MSEQSTRFGPGLVSQMMDVINEHAQGSSNYQPHSPVDPSEALAVLVWVKLSHDKRIPELARFKPAFVAKPELALEALSHRFEPDNLSIPRIAELVSDLGSALQPALQLAQRATSSGVLQRFTAIDAAEISPQCFALASTMARLASIRPQDAIYVGWDLDVAVAIGDSEEGASVYLEYPGDTWPVPYLVSLIAERPFEVHYSDPIESPSAVEGGKPRRFDVAISIPPSYPSRYEPEVAQQDWFGRFPEQTTSGAVLAVRQALSQASRRVVIAVPNTLLFSPGGEFALRKDLITKGNIEAVIAMPGGVTLGTNNPFAVLVLDPSGGHKEIRFISAPSVRISGTKERQINIDGLIELFSDVSTTDDAVTVPTTDVLRNDSQLQVNRYLLSGAKKLARGVVSNHASVQLGKVVDTVRPMPTTTQEDDCIEALEIGAADIPSAGYIRKAGRTVMIDRQEAEKNERQFLRPLDIVLIVKGSVGKVGIVPPTAPPPGTGGWIAGQSALVLRTGQGEVDPRALAVQLRSTFGQELLRGVVSGASIPLIQKRELLRMEVLLPDPALTRESAQALEREEQLQDEIDRLREAQSEAAKDLWSLERFRSPMSTSDMGTKGRK